MSVNSTKASVTANVVYDKRKNTYDSLPEGVNKALCLISGGMDSATCLFHMVNNYGKDNVIALSLFYGQKNEKELKCAQAECNKLGVMRYEMNISDIFKFNTNYSAYLQGSDRDIENESYADIMKKKIANGEAPISDEYIPNRNSLLMNIAASIGLQLFNNEKFVIVTGIHNDDILKQEGSNVGAYPDCSEEWAFSLNKLLQIATAGLVYVYTPLANMTKTQVAKFGIKNGMIKDDFKNTWSCYRNGEKQCGVCPTDRDKIKALIVGAAFNKKDILEIFNLSEDKFEEIYGDFYYNH